MKAPVRPCCGQRHFTVACPDGKIQCCICWGRFDTANLNPVGDTVENVCRQCADDERKEMVRRGK